MRQTKATSGTDGGNYQAAIRRRLPGRQVLPNVAVTGTILGTRTYAYGILGLGMLSYPSVESVLPGTARGIWPASDNTKVFSISSGTASMRSKCGHTSSRSGREWRYHPRKWSCTSKQHCRGRHLSYLRVYGRLSSKCSLITLTSLAKPGKEYGG